MGIDIVQGLPLHSGDDPDKPTRSPVKPKVVATLGSESSYSAGILTDNGHKAGDEISLRELVEGFFDNGVNVIRLNLSHNDVDQIPRCLQEIKLAALTRESGQYRRGPIALLADLPGPKIRLKLAGPSPQEAKGLDVELDQEIRIHLEQVSTTAGGGAILLNGLPLKKALDELDQVRSTESIPVGNNLEERIAREDDLGSIVENAFGAMPSRSGRRSSSYRSFLEQLRKKLQGEGRLLAFVGDGDLLLNVQGIHSGEEGEYLRCEVLSARVNHLGDRKGFTLKGIDLDIPAFTSTDQKKLKALLDADHAPPPTDLPPGVKWHPLVAFVGVSFAQTAHDLLAVKQFIHESVPRVPHRHEGEDGDRIEPPSVIAKIETLKGYNNRRFILDVADGLMVARGDLGLQTEPEEVPRLQKTLTDLCRKRGKPVIIATQMLSSMVDSIEPTRAEVTDVFNAVLDGCDAVMTSDETSSGRYPFHAIRTMLKIAAEAEKFREFRGLDASHRRQECRHSIEEFLRDDLKRIQENEERIRRIHSELASPGPSPNSYRSWRKELYHSKLGKAERQETTNSITEAACILAEGQEPVAILAATTSGRTVRMLSRFRPTKLIVGAAHDDMNTRKLAIVYGVFPIEIPVLEPDADIGEMFEECCKAIGRQPYLQRFLEDESTVIFTAGTPVVTPGTTNHIAKRQLKLEKASSRPEL